MYELVGIGNPVYDIIQTPHMSSEDRILSGCSTNACLAARKLGLHPVALVGNVGQSFASRFREDMKRYGVEGFISEVGADTGGFKLVYDDRGDRTLDVIGVAGPIKFDKIPRTCLSARYILLGPILAEVDLRLVGSLKTSSSARIFLDPQGIIRIVGPDGRVQHKANESELRRLLAQVDIVKPNEMEARVMTGSADPVKNAVTLHEWGAPIAIVTLAERGSIVYDGASLYRIPAFKTTAIDPTGAGDVYAGSFIREYTRSNDLLKAGVFASAAASMMVEHVGPSFPLSESAVQERVRKIEGLASVEELD